MQLATTVLLYDDQIDFVQMAVSLLRHKYTSAQASHSLNKLAFRLGIGFSFFCTM
jgi:hypothetical protein